KTLSVHAILQEVGHSHQADTVEAVTDERVKVVTSLLAIRDDIDAGIFLILDGQERRLVLQGAQVRTSAPHGFQQARRPRPTTHDRDRKERPASHHTLRSSSCTGTSRKNDCVTGERLRVSSQSSCSASSSPSASM